MKWFRLYHDAPSHPRMRLIAHKSGTSVSNVLAVWVTMLCHASRQEPRGTLNAWDDLECALMLGIGEDIVFCVRREMEGRLIDGDHIRGWNDRQSPRDDSGERVRRFRERKQNQTVSDDVTRYGVTVTPCNEQIRGEEIRGEEIRIASVSTIEVGHAPRKARRLPPDWQPSPEDAGYADKIGLDPSRVCENFRDYWHAKSGAGATKLDWSATWRMWCRREAERRPTIAPQQKPGKYDWIIDDLQQGKLT
jgi:hypothetical protein